MTVLRDTLTSLGHACSAKNGWLELPNGLTLLPQVVSVEPRDDDTVKTTSTVQTAHSALFPKGVFEYQHATGSDLVQSFSAGFKDWAELDLPVFLDAFRLEPETCMLLSFDEKKHPGRPRRVVLGPPSRAVQTSTDPEDEHAFCPCCFFTNCHSAFKALLESGTCHGIRLFAMRNADGVIEADCRVNGEDYGAGKDELIRYGETWPNRGFEFRKQYALIQPVR